MQATTVKTTMRRTKTKVDTDMILLTLLIIRCVLAALPHLALTAHAAKSDLVRGGVFCSDHPVDGVKLPLPFIDRISEGLPFILVLAALMYHGLLH